MQVGLRHKHLPIFIGLSTWALVLGLAATRLWGERLHPSVTGPERSGRPSVLGTRWSGNEPVISVSDNKWGQNGGLISMSFRDEPKVKITSYNLDKRQVRVDVYRAELTTVLAYLTVNDEYQQVSPNVDTTGLSLIGSYDYTVGGYNSSETLDLPLEGTGIWLLKVINEAIETDAFIVRSKNGVLLKEGNNQFIFWAQDLDSRRSASGGTLKLYSMKNGPTEKSTVVFSDQGIATALMATEIDIGVYERDGDVAIVPINMQYLNREWSQKWQTKPLTTKYFIFTDRPLYKPGDTLYFKAILRDDDDARYTIPSGQATVQVYSGWGEERETIYEGKVPVTSWGSVDGEVELPEDIKTRQYMITVSMEGRSDRSENYWDDNRGTAYFAVEHYRKPDYFLKVKSDREEYIAGETMRFVISGQYFFGEPLVNKQVSYQIRKGFYYGYGAADDSGLVTIGEDGIAVVEVTAKQIEGHGGSYTLTAKLVDETGTADEAAQNVHVYAGEFWLSRSNYRYGFRVNQPLEMPITAWRSGVEKETVAGQELEVKGMYYWWEKMPLADGEKWHRYERREEAVAGMQLTTDEKGEAVIRMTPTRGGSYEFVVTGTDSRGNVVTSTFNAWVNTTGVETYSIGEGELQVKANVERAAPGDEITLTLLSDVADRDVFLSFERARVDRYQIVNLTGYTGEVTVKLLDQDLPNVFIEASSFSDDWLDTSQLEMAVITASRELTVDLVTDKEEYGPGDRVTVDVVTRDGNGNKVSAEVALWAVDKALFELMDRNDTDIFRAFWSSRWNSTQEAHSLQGIVALTAEKGGGGGGDEARAVFADTAYWNPRVITSGAGQARVQFALPDNLTTWTVSAVGAAINTAAGDSQKDIVVSKKVIVRPALPNLMRIGDEVRVSALVHNYTDVDQKFDVAADFDSGTIETATVSGLMVKAGGFGEAAFVLRPKTANDNAAVTIGATGVDDEAASDVVVSRLPVIPFGFVERRGGAASGEHAYEISLSSDADVEQSSVVLQLSSSLVGMVPKAMEYLVGYPYGCVEQTMSRLVPIIVAYENRNLLGETLLDKDVPDMVAEGMKRLTELQNSDGGFSWWWANVENSDPFVTAYVSEYLVRAREAGLEVPDSIIEGVRRFVESDAFLTAGKDRGMSGEDVLVARQHAWLFLDAKKAVPVKVENVSVDLLPWAVIVNTTLGDNNVATNGVQALLSRAVIEGEMMSWPAGSAPRYGSVDATTGLALKALLTADYEREALTRVARYLTTQRKRHFWYNTFGTVQAIEGLVNFSQAGSESTPQYTYAVRLDGQQLATGTVTGSSQKLADVAVPLDNLVGKPGSLEVTYDGEGQLYSSLVIDEFHTSMEAGAKSEGIRVERAYIPEKGAGYTLALGDTVTVRLRISGLKTAGQYGVLVDELPAGLVPINPKFKNESNERETNYFWRRGVNGYEITENGIVISLSSIDPGMMEYNYKARVVNAGTFAVPPATASLMYNPEIYGRSSAEVVKVGMESTFDPLLAARIGIGASAQPTGLQKEAWRVQAVRYGLALLVLGGYFAGVVWYRKKHGV